MVLNYYISVDSKHSAIGKAHMPLQRLNRKLTNFTHQPRHGLGRKLQFSDKRLQLSKSKISIKGKGGVKRGSENERCCRHP